MSNSAEEIKKQEHIKKALELRKHGHSYSTIATTLGIAKSSAWRYVDEGLGELKTECRSEAEELRELEEMRMDALLPKLMEKAVKGDVLAIDRVLAISRERRKLRGLDAPTSFKFANISDDDLLGMAQQAMIAAGVGGDDDDE